MKADKKFFALVLHSHIPYVLSHGRWPHGEDWLYEAAAECYLPLLDVFDRLASEGLAASVTISLTPVLADQLKSPDFKSGFENYLKMKIKAAQNDLHYFQKTNPELISTTRFWLQWYEKLYADFISRWQRDIISALASLAREKLIELITSGATHGYFPLLSRDSSIQHQVRQARYIHKKYFGLEPAGFWLPECAYRPGYLWQSPAGGEASFRKGVDEILKEEGLKYFFVDTHLLKKADIRGVYFDIYPRLRSLWENFSREYQHELNKDKPLEKDPYYPYLASPSLTPFITRDEITGSQVWSRSGGYPGDADYLEFHKKNFPGGLRYWRITSTKSDLGQKLPYEINRATSRIEEHASHFVSLIENLMSDKKEGLVAAMYDTELFGHWWFEGPEWLYNVIRKIQPSTVRMARISDCLDFLEPAGVVSLPEGSWGQGGFHTVWLNQDTSWIWDKIYQIEQKAEKIYSSYKPQSRTEKRLLKQFIREKFLLESSDWPFLITTWSARDYAELRAASHYERALKIAEWIERRSPLLDNEKASLKVFEQEDNLFEEVIFPDGTIF